jgi:hypothetical protein
LARCKLSALAVALIYNWWSLFVRLKIPKPDLEAITSRPFLLCAMARQITHGGAQHLTIISQQAHANKAQSILTAIHASINQFKVAAEQLKTRSVLQLVCEHILTTVARFRSKVPRVLAPPTLAPINGCF